MVRGRQEESRIKALGISYNSNCNITPGIEVLGVDSAVEFLKSKGLVYISGHYQITYKPHPSSNRN